MEAILSVIGKVGPPGLLGVAILMFFMDKIVTAGHLNRLLGEKDAHIAALKSTHLEALAMANSTHSESLVLITTAHNLRVTEMTEAHDKARADHQKQIETITSQNNAQYDKAMEMANQQVTWSVTRVNDWKEAYDVLIGALPPMAHTIENIAKAMETVEATYKGIKEVAERNEQAH